MKFESLKQYLATLSSLGLINFHKPPTKTILGKRVVIRFEKNTRFRDEPVEGTVDQFLHDVQTKNFSIILCDGSLVQIQYELERNKIVSHRYCYIPLPVNVLNPSDIDSLERQIRLSIQNDQVFLRSRIRFDYDQGQEDHVHPESHLTFISQNCRIPVRGGLGIKRFFRFIYGNFIDKNLVERNPSMFKPPKEHPVSLSEKWSDELHMNWLTRIPSDDRL